MRIIALAFAMTAAALPAWARSSTMGRDREPSRAGDDLPCLIDQAQRPGLAAGGLAYQISIEPAAGRSMACQAVR